MHDLQNKGNTGNVIKQKVFDKFSLTEKDISIFQPKNKLTVSYNGEVREI